MARHLGMNGVLHPDSSRLVRRGPQEILDKYIQGGRGSLVRWAGAKTAGRHMGVICGASDNSWEARLWAWIHIWTALLLTSARPWHCQCRDIETELLPNQ